MLEQYLKQITFLACYWRFPYPQTLEQLKCQLNK